MLWKIIAGESASMTHQALELLREHHFYVAIAKFLFYHPEHGIVSAQDPIKIKDAEQYGLRPLILYGLTAAGLQSRWMTFSTVEQPRTLRDVLLDAWGNFAGLRGKPDVLRVSRTLALASPDLFLDMAKLGIQVEVAEAKEKSLPASLRSAQDFSKGFPGRRSEKDQLPVEVVKAFCQDVQDYHDGYARGTYRYVTSRELENSIQRWLTLPMREVKPVLLDGLDWTPGPWLSSWESSLPPNPPRYFNLDRSGGRVWLITGEQAPEDNDEDDSWGDDYYDNVAEIARNLVACWPNSPAEIATCAGITLRKLQWFIGGKIALDEQSRFNLENLLGIEYDERKGEYTGAGPYVLVARNPAALEEAYLAISHGGDAHSFEIVPYQAPADPSWRYVLINTCGEPLSIVMVSRGSKIAERLSVLFLSYAGIASVSPAFYRDVVSSCSRACRDPMSNVREMTGFARRYEEHWARGAWQL